MNSLDPGSNVFNVFLNRKFFLSNILSSSSCCIFIDVFIPKNGYVIWCDMVWWNMVCGFFIKKEKRTFFNQFGEFDGIWIELNVPFYWIRRELLIKFCAKLTLITLKCFIFESCANLHRLKPEKANLHRTTVCRRKPLKNGIKILSSWLKKEQQNSLKQVVKT